MTDTTSAIDIPGRCNICGEYVRFRATGSYLRNELKCPYCGSAPRERALMAAIDDYAPDWRQRTIHESSPVMRGLSLKLSRECPNYTSSQYDADITFGTTHPTRGYRSENLECLTFPDATFDLVVTQDVFEHLFDPLAAFREISRVLKPGGLFIQTVPLVHGLRPSRRRARINPKDGLVEHILPESYHGNPVGDGRSLVTVDWGYDIAVFALKVAGLATTIYRLETYGLDIRVPLNEVVVSLRTHTMPDLVP